MPTTAWDLMIDDILGRSSDSSQEGISSAFTAIGPPFRSAGVGAITSRTATGAWAYAVTSCGAFSKYSMTESLEAAASVASAAALREGRNRRRTPTPASFPLLRIWHRSLDALYTNADLSPIDVISRANELLFNFGSSRSSVARLASTTDKTISFITG